VPQQRKTVNKLTCLFTQVVMLLMLPLFCVDAFPHLPEVYYLVYMVHR
jgi:hypothetical protein